MARDLNQVFKCRAICLTQLYIRPRRRCGFCIDRYVLHRRITPATFGLGRLALTVSAALLVACEPRVRDASEAAPPAPVVRVAKVASLEPGAVALPNTLTSTKFAVIGDSGRGTPPQHDIAAQMIRAREAFRFAFVIMLGDNIYEGPATPEDYRRKFEEPYGRLLTAGVKFYAVLGNHDDPLQVHYKPFNMNGERYYTLAPPEDLLAKIVTRVEFFAIDSTNLDRQQVRWLDERLARSTAQWKIAVLHHPLYTSGRYRNTARAHRWALEPLFVHYGVDVVFSGHEHIYQRSELQNGIQYFVSGGAGSLRLGDGVPASYVAKNYDDDYHFMLIEIDGDELHFQAMSRAGLTIDAGTLYQDGEEARDAGPTTAGTAAPR